jgi:hypothetical protein
MPASQLNITRNTPLGANLAPGRGYFSHLGASSAGGIHCLESSGAVPRRMPIQNTRPICSRRMPTVFGPASCPESKTATCIASMLSARAARASNAIHTRVS